MQAKLGGMVRGGEKGIKLIKVKVKRLTTFLQVQEIPLSLPPLSFCLSLSRKTRYGIGGFSYFPHIHTPVTVRSTYCS